jgi:RNA polymerase sigma factor (sigma-70 family)
MGTDDFEQLFEAHAQGLFAFLVYRGADRSLAEEVVADAFERLYRSRDRFDERKGSAKSWLFSIALNRLRDLQRRASVEARAVDGMRGDEPAVAASFEDGVLDRDRLARALLELSAEERDAVTLRFGGGLTVPEVAEVVGEPLKRVEGRVYRGLRKLRAELGDE